MAKTKTLEQRAAAALPLSVYRTLVRRDLVVFVYHLISPDPPAYVRHIYPSKTPREFEQDLLYLKEQFNPIHYEDYLTYRKGGRRLPPRACLVTVDDGYQECFSIVRPLLSAHQMPCVFFLTTDFLDNQVLFYRNKYSLCADALALLSEDEVEEFLALVNRRPGVDLKTREAALEWLRSIKPSEEGALDEACRLLGVEPQAVLQSNPFLTRAQARQLASEGFTLGAHSQRHVKFKRLSEREIEEEIIGSCREVASLSSQAVVPFAFPFSGAGLDRQLLGTLVKKYDFLAHYFDSHGVRKDRPFIINRVWADTPPVPRGETNLGTLLHAAYQENALWRPRYYLSTAIRRSI